MRDITFAPAYVALYPILAEVARDNGYSLTIHGSVGRTEGSDIDFVACPWIEECSTSDQLIKAIADNWLVKSFNKRLIRNGLDAEIKPHGRLAYRFSLGNGACVDISVMPSRCITNNTLGLNEVTEYD